MDSPTCKVSTFFSVSRLSSSSPRVLATTPELIAYLYLVGTVQYHTSYIIQCSLLYQYVCTKLHLVRRMVLYFIY